MSDLPNGWKVTKLGEVAVDINNRTDNPKESGLKRFVGLEHFDSGNLIITRWASTEDVTSSMKLFKKGDVLFARRNAYLRRSSMSEFDGVCSGDAFVLRQIDGAMATNFLPLILNTELLWDYAISNSAGSMSKRVKWRDLAKFEFPLPPLDVQKRIAEILWAIEDVIRQYESSLHLTETLFCATLDKLLKDESQLSKPGWEELSVSDVATIRSGGTPRKSKAQYWNGDIPWASPKDIKQLRIDDTIDHVTFGGTKNGKDIIKGNSTLVVVRGMILVHGVPIAITTNPMSFNQDLKGLIPNPNVNPEFLFYSILSRERTLFRKVGTSAHGTKRLPTNALSELQIFFNNIPEIQDKIVKSIKVIELFEKQFQDRLIIINKLKHRLLNDLLSGEIDLRSDF